MTHELAVSITAIADEKVCPSAVLFVSLSMHLWYTGESADARSRTSCRLVWIGRATAPGSTAGLPRQNLPLYVSLPLNC